MKEYILQFNEGLYNEETGEVVFKPEVVEELVRCKDCMYWQDNGDLGELCNWREDETPDADDYCSCGVKKI